MMSVVPPSMEFRRNPEQLRMVMEWLNNPTTRLVLDMAQNENPARTSPLRAGATEIDCARAYGVQEGWSQAISFIIGLAQPIAQPDQFIETFGVEEDISNG